MKRQSGRARAGHCNNSNIMAPAMQDAAGGAGSLAKKSVSCKRKTGLRMALLTCLIGDPSAIPRELPCCSAELQGLAPRSARQNPSLNHGPQQEHPLCTFKSLNMHVLSSTMTACPANSNLRSEFALPAQERAWCT